MCVSNNYSYNSKNQNWNNDLIPTKVKLGQFILPRLVKLNVKVLQVMTIDRLKFVYTAGYGNYAILLNSNILKNYLKFLLPSGSILITSWWCFLMLGSNPYKNRKKFISNSNKNSLRSKKKSVRGVAMNPVDHHNGGRAKKKPLFLNKFNNIAKNNK